MGFIMRTAVVDELQHVFVAGDDGHVDIPAPRRGRRACR